MRISFAILLPLAIAGCDSPPATQPEEFDVVNATQVDPAVAPGALGNETVNYPEGNITPGEREPIRNVETQSPAQVVAHYANLIVQRRFEEAHRMWDPGAAGFTAEQLKQRFERFKTIQAEVGDAAPPEGAAGSIYDDVRLTFSGTRKDGSNYTVTGLVTVRRANDVPGSTAEQRRWRIVKMVLTANPKAAEALVQQ